MRLSVPVAVDYTLRGDSQGDGESRFLVQKISSDCLVNAVIGLTSAVKVETGLRIAPMLSFLTFGEDCSGVLPEREHAPAGRSLPAFTGQVGHGVDAHCVHPMSYLPNSDSRHVMKGAARFG